MGACQDRLGQVGLNFGSLSRPYLSPFDSTTIPRHNLEHMKLVAARAAVGEGSRITSRSDGRAADQGSGGGDIPRRPNSALIRGSSFRFEKHAGESKRSSRGEADSNPRRSNSLGDLPEMSASASADSPESSTVDMSASASADSPESSTVDERCVYHRQYHRQPTAATTTTK